MLQAGTSAPDIRLLSLTGEEVVLAEQLKQGSVALVFFKVSCPTCQFSLPFLERLYSAQSAGAPRILGISQDGAAATLEFNRRFGIHFPVLLDPAKDNYPASNAYRITNVPSLFLVEEGGRIAWALNGFHKGEMERLGERFGQSPFEHGERVPALRPG